MRFIKGECYCGEVKFEVDVPEKAEGNVDFCIYCNCESCRRSHSAPVSQIMYVSKSLVRFTSGKSLIKGFQKVEGKDPIRSFCSKCGTKVKIEHPEWKPNSVGLFPCLLDDTTQHDLPEVFHPQKVNEPDSSMLHTNVLFGGKK
jgi:hypothetical protein